MPRTEVYFLIITLSLAAILGIQARYVGGHGLLEEMEILFEFLNMIVALVAAIFAFNVARKFGLNVRDGASWRWFAIAAFMFSLVELHNLLRYLGVFNIEGLYEFLEFIFIIALAWGFWAQKQVLTDIIQVISKRVIPHQ
ncbi:MAG: hypothetical protein HZA25_02760 [Candidatus Niyogibacteria bacterium]|nr:hypothetical protein [Candidatus Niyogibacteria bacterium]